MKGKEPARVGLLVALFAVLAMAFNVAGASATKVTTAKDNFEAVAGKTKFITNNGAGLEVVCAKSVAKGTVPGAAGAYEFNSIPGGSVIGPISSLTFTECTGATVTVKGPNTYTAFNVGETATHLFGINLVPDAATIVAGACTITTPDDRVATGGVAGSVIGTFTNGTTSASTLSIKGQLPFKENGGCGTQKSQAVFFANGESGTTVYTVSDTTTPANKIKVEGP